MRIKAWKLAEDVDINIILLCISVTEAGSGLLTQYKRKTIPWIKEVAETEGIQG